jgi:hypothetical protein
MKGNDLDKVEKLAGFVDQNLKSLGKSIASAEDVGRTLRTTSWISFELLKASGAGASAEVLLGKVRNALSLDEAEVQVGSALSQYAAEANAILKAAQPVVPPAPPATPPVSTPATAVEVTKDPPSTGYQLSKTRKSVEKKQFTGCKVDEVRADVSALMKLLEKRPSARVDISWEVTEDS